MLPYKLWTSKNKIKYGFMEERKQWIKMLSTSYSQFVDNICKLIMVKFISMDKCGEKEKPLDFVFENYIDTNFWKI